METTVSAASNVQQQSTKEKHEQCCRNDRRGQNRSESDRKRQLQINQQSALRPARSRRLVRRWRRRWQGTSDVDSLRTYILQLREPLEFTLFTLHVKSEAEIHKICDRNNPENVRSLRPVWSGTLDCTRQVNLARAKATPRGSNTKNRVRPTPTLDWFQSASGEVGPRLSNHENCHDHSITEYRVPIL